MYLLLLLLLLLLLFFFFFLAKKYQVVIWLKKSTSLKYYVHGLTYKDHSKDHFSIYGPTIKESKKARKPESQKASKIENKKERNLRYHQRLC